MPSSFRATRLSLVAPTTAKAFWKTPFTAALRRPAVSRTASLACLSSCAPNRCITRARLKATTTAVLIVISTANFAPTVARARAAPMECPTLRCETLPKHT